MSRPQSMPIPRALPVPALTGQCPACGMYLCSADGLTRHNEHASIGERSYLIREGSRFVHLFKREAA